LSRRALALSVLSAALAGPISLGCSGEAATDDPVGVGGTGTGGSTTGGTGTGGSTTGGTSGTGTGGTGTTTGGTGGATMTGGTGGSATAGAGGTATGGSAGMGMGGASAGMGGTTPGGSGGGAGAAAGMGGAPGGSGGSAGSGVAGSFVGGGAGGGPPVEPLDCGGKGTALENNGPPANRVNYVIVADGYSESELAAGGALDDHMEAMLEKRFSEPVGQPYKRYRKFVNICVLRMPSSPICGSSVFGCCGNDSSRLANCNTSSVNNAISENMPDSFEVSWRAVVLNGDSWWNSGGTTMMWSGGHGDAGGAALHEGGHGFHALSDEYGNCEQGRVSREATYGVNVSLMNGSTGGKWEGWLDYNQTPGTGMQGFFACDGGQTWRPSSNSMMNSLFGDDPDTSYNPVSREKIVMDFWRYVETPYDSVSPPAGAVTNSATLTVNVIDPLVINVDWTVDGTMVAANGGPTYNIGAANLASGMHTVTARAYDNAGMDLVRQVPGNTFGRQYWGSGAMGHSDKTVTWTVTIP
jgi:hypothetical protein